jgi:hypothetical protein
MSDTVMPHVKRQMEQEGRFRVTIGLIGCDDTTIFHVWADDHIYEALREIAQQSSECSTYQCMPVMEVARVPAEKQHGKEASDV